MIRHSRRDGGASINYVAWGAELLSCLGASVAQGGKDRRKQSRGAYISYLYINAVCINYFIRILPLLITIKQSDII